MSQNEPPNLAAVRQPDPLIDEVRRARQWVEDQHGPDLRAMAEKLRRMQSQRKGRVIAAPTPPTKRAG